MENNTLLEKLKKGEKPVGVFFNTGTPVSLELLGEFGYDFVFIDAEHGQYDLQQIELFIRACEARHLCPIVRIVEPTRNYILKCLDMGAMGLLIPYIKTADQVRAAVALAKYPPFGERGLGHAHKVAYGRDPIVLGAPEAYLNWANENTIIIPQCETKEAVENIDEICAVPGVAGIFIGPFDLSIALGVPCQFDNPIFTAAVDKVQKACKKAGVFSMILGANPTIAKQRFDQGFDAIVGPSDTAFLMAAEKEYVDGVNAIKNS